MEKKNYDEAKVDLLLSEFKENRDRIRNMISELETYIDRVKAILPSPTDRDFRNLYVFENKLKTMTEFFKLILDMRKEVGKLLREEIQLITKLDDDSTDEVTDIHRKVKAIDKFLQESGQKINALNKIKAA